MNESSPRTRRRRLLDGLMLNCPRCGAPTMFRGWEINDDCSECGYRFFAEEGEFTGALMLAQGFFLIIALTGFAILVAGFDAGIAWGAGWLLTSGVVAPIVLYRNLKGLWVAVLHVTHAERHHPSIAGPEWADEAHREPSAERVALHLGRGRGRV